MLLISLGQIIGMLLPELGLWPSPTLFRGGAASSARSGARGRVLLTLLPSSTSLESNWDVPLLGRKATFTPC